MPATAETTGDRVEEVRDSVLTDARATGIEVLPLRRFNLRRYATTPILVGLVLLALYLYVGSQELDSIEQRALTAQKITDALTRHIFIAVLATALVVLLAVPTGILLTRPFARSLRPPLLAIANTGQCVPSIGVIAILALAVTGIGLRTVLIALVAYAFLPILRNTMVGLQGVDAAVIESARGMGMTKAGVLTRIELPLAVPVMLAGIRTALVITVGTGALATFVNGGGLGDIINQGLVQNRFVVILTGGVLTGALALLIDWVAAIAEDVLRPRGL